MHQRSTIDLKIGLSTALALVASFVVYLAPMPAAAQNIGSNEKPSAALLQAIKDRAQELAQQQGPNQSGGSYKPAEGGNTGYGAGSSGLGSPGSGTKPAVPSLLPCTFCEGPNSDMSVKLQDMQKALEAIQARSGATPNLQGPATSGATKPGAGTPVPSAQGGSVGAGSPVKASGNIAADLSEISALLQQIVKRLQALISQ